MKIGLLITARLKSSRLPLKLLKDLNGFSMIEHVILRSKKIFDIDDIILCTSNNPQDKPLTDIAVNNGIHYYLGSEEDVLDRLNNASQFFGLDYIVNITGENPVFSIEYANRLVDLMKKEKPDFATIEGLPIGTAVYGINSKALEVVCKVKTEIDTEIWGVLFNQPEIFSISKIQTEEYFTRSDLRLTNDYPEDFKMMSKIFSFFPYRTLPSLHEVLNILDDNQEIVEINKGRDQVSLSPNVISRVNSFYEKNANKILTIKKEIYSK